METKAPSGSTIMIAVFLHREDKENFLGVVPLMSNTNPYTVVAPASTISTAVFGFERLCFSLCLCLLLTLFSSFFPLILPNERLHRCCSLVILCVILYMYVYTCFGRFMKITGRLMNRGEEAKSNTCLCCITSVVVMARLLSTNKHAYLHHF